MISRSENHIETANWLRCAPSDEPRKAFDERGRWWMFEGDVKPTGIAGPFFYCQDDDEPFRESLPAGKYIRGGKVEVS